MSGGTFVWILGLTVCLGWALFTLYAGFQHNRARRITPNGLRSKA